MQPPPYEIAGSSTASLPLYSPSDASPNYAEEPSPEEQRLDYVARTNDQRSYHNTLTRKMRKITVTLRDQESDATMPTYARNSLVRGELELEREENIISVQVMLEGRQTLSVAEGGSSIRLLFLHMSTVWTKGSSKTCPTVLPFSIPFPLTYKDKDASHPVPPSFTAAFPGIPGLSGKNSYTLSIHVTKYRLGTWKKRKIISLPVQYTPRTRPFLPICPGLHPFLSTVKSSPGEWHQVNSCMPSRDERVDPIDCHLFIPAVQIYALSDTIPFHLQLRGSSKSLDAFLNPPPPSTKSSKRLSLGLSRSSRSSSTTTRSSISTSSSQYLRASNALLGVIPRPATLRGEEPAPMIRVFILRQITAKVHHQKAWRNVVLGEGKLWPLQRGSMEEPDSDEEGQKSMDWEGEVRCNSDVTVGGFAAGEFVVKDFMVLHLCPSIPETSSLMEHQHAHPIRLVTDTYREAYDYSLRDQSLFRDPRPSE